MADRPRVITRVEQDQQGLLRQRTSNYVPPAIVPARPSLPAQTTHSMGLEVMPSATQQVIMHTSAVDRAKGFTIVLLPLATVLGILAVIVRIALLDYPLLAMGTLLIFWVTFTFCWLVGWGTTLLMSAEGVAFFEAKRKWDIIAREQEERWNYYRGE